MTDQRYAIPAHSAGKTSDPHVRRHGRRPAVFVFVDQRRSELLTSIRTQSPASDKKDPVVEGETGEN